MRGPTDEGRGTRDERTRDLRTEVRDRRLEKLNVRRSEGEKVRILMAEWMLRIDRKLEGQEARMQWYPEFGRRGGKD